MTKSPQIQLPQQLLQVLNDCMQNFRVSQPLNLKKAPDIHKLELVVRSLNLQRQP